MVGEEDVSQLVHLTAQLLAVLNTAHARERQAEATLHHEPIFGEALFRWW